MATRNTTVLSALLLAILGGGVWAFWPGTGEADAGSRPPAPVVEKEPAPAATPMVAPDVRPAPRPQRNPRDTSRMTRLPDGSYLPNLNGVREPMVWNEGAAPAFTPIVGIRRTNLGQDWWVHENGLQSATVIVEGTRNGVPFREPNIQYALPTETLPAAGTARKN